MSAPLSDLSHIVSLLPRQSGVYKMCNADGDVIYVGKARDLFKRVSSYFNRAHDAKTAAMVAQIASIDTIVTSTETAALLLEAELIKSLKPKYNILLKDDKSYPYLQLTTDHPYPRLDFYRGAKKGGVFFLDPIQVQAQCVRALLLSRRFLKFASVRIFFLRIALGLVCSIKLIDAPPLA